MIGIAPEPVMLFFASLFFNLAVAILIFLFLGGLRLLRDAPEGPKPSEPLAPEMERERLLTLLALGAMAIATILSAVDIAVASMIRSDERRVGEASVVRGRCECLQDQKIKHQQHTQVDNN